MDETGGGRRRRGGDGDGDGREGGEGMDREKQEEVFRALRMSERREIDDLDKPTQPAGEVDEEDKIFLREKNAEEEEARRMVHRRETELLEDFKDAVLAYRLDVRAKVEAMQSSGDAIKQQTDYAVNRRLPPLLGASGRASSIIASRVVVKRAGADAAAPEAGSATGGAAKRLQPSTGALAGLAGYASDDD